MTTLTMQDLIDQIKKQAKQRQKNAAQKAAKKAAKKVALQNAVRMNRINSTTQVVVEKLSKIGRVTVNGKIQKPTTKKVTKKSPLVTPVATGNRVMKTNTSPLSRKEKAALNRQERKAAMLVMKAKLSLKAAKVALTKALGLRAAEVSKLTNNIVAFGATNGNKLAWEVIQADRTLVEAKEAHQAIKAQLA